MSVSNFRDHAPILFAVIYPSGKRLVLVFSGQDMLHSRNAQYTLHILLQLLSKNQFCRKFSFSVPLNAKSSCRCGEQVNWLDWIFLEYLNRFNQRPKYTISWGKFTHSPDFNPDQGIRPPPFIKGYLGTM